MLNSSALEFTQIETGLPAAIPDCFHSTLAVAVSLLPPPPLTAATPVPSSLSISSTMSLTGNLLSAL